MLEVYQNLFVGDEADGYSVINLPGWSIVHACKEPFHREALAYTGRAASKEHPEYYFARRDNRLCLNLIDAEDPKWIPDVIIDAALIFIKERLAAGDKVLVHCNQGMSRSPSIALLYMCSEGKITNNHVEKFKVYYPFFQPSAGMLGVIEKRIKEVYGPQYPINRRLS